MEKTTINKWKIKNAKLLIVLFILLNIIFVLAVNDLYVFKKASLSANLIYDFNFFKFILSLIVTFFLIICSAIANIRGFLYSVLILILIFFIFPAMILFVNVRNLTPGIIISHCFLFAAVLIIGKIRIKLKSDSLDLRFSRKILLIVIIVGLIPFVILYLPYLNLKNLLLMEIYETRALMSRSINNLYTDYTYSWFNKILIPVLIVFGIYFRSKLTILLSIVSLIFLYLCGAHKAVFVGMIMVFILYKYDYIEKMNYFIKVIILITFISLFFSVAIKYDYITIMTVRRTLFLPSLLDVLYFDFFKDNYIYWSETFNGLFYDYPYNYIHSYVIGEHYFQSKVWGANNGIISDGYMNWGYIGVVINSIIVGFYFSIINQLNISSKFFGVFFLFFFVLISSALSSALITHGGLFLVIVSFYLLKNTGMKMDSIGN